MCDKNTAQIRFTPLANGLLIGALLSFAALLAVPVEAQTVRHNRVEVEKEQLMVDILQLALQHSAPGASMEPASEILPAARVEEMVADGGLSVMWGGASNAREEKMMAVRIPALKGLLGHRIFIIRRDAQYKFDSIDSLSELKNLKAGQGRKWGDTQVIQQMGFTVVTAVKNPNLFPMLEGGRFDYFPRAAHEPWSEVEKHRDLDLAVEQRILLIYPQPMYFYVAKGNQALHDLIYQGLETAMLNGSYDQLFFNHPMIKSGLEQAKLKERKIFRIDNPLLHPDTPLDRKEFWLDVENL